MAWEVKGTIKGADGKDGRDGKDGGQGPKGDAGSIASASAVSVPADRPARVIMSGTEAVKHAHFEVPRGLPGVNAIPGSEAVAAWVAAPDSPIRQAMHEFVPVFLFWNGTSYPPRVEGAFNIFVGPVFPGILMSGDDQWENQNVVDMDSIVAAMSNPASALRAATATVAGGSVMTLDVGPDAGGSVMGTYGTAPGVLYAWSLAKGGTNSVRFSGVVPPNWNTVRARVSWVHEDAGTAARLGISFRIADATGAVAEVGSTADRTSLGVLKVNTTVTATGTVTAGQVISGTVTRLSDTSSDTIAGRVGVLAVVLERIS